MSNSINVISVDTPEGTIGTVTRMIGTTAHGEVSHTFRAILISHTDSGLAVSELAPDGDYSALVTFIGCDEFVAD